MNVHTLVVKYALDKGKDTKRIILEHHKRLFLLKNVKMPRQQIEISINR